jgi:hypothetical protein
MKSHCRSHRVLVGSFAIVTAVLVQASITPAASAISCDPPTTLRNVQGVADDPSNDPNSNIQGAHSKIHVNDLSGDPQCYIGRSILVIKNIQTDYVEIGWIVGDAVPYLHSQNQTVIYDGDFDGIPITNVLTVHHPAPDSDHQFKIANGDANNDWAVIYDGNELDRVPQTYSHGAKMLTNTEKHYPNDDSLWAHFQGIGICTHVGSGCDPYFHTPASLQEYDASNNHTNYLFCKIDNSEHYVRKNLC